MKKLLIIVIVVTLPLIAYFQYAEWRRYNPSTDYAYPIAEGIDVNYYNPAVVAEYFDNAVEIGRFAREKYSNEDIDVLFPDNTNIEALTASKYYHNLIARNKFIEAKLKSSAELKNKGLTTSQTRMVIEEGASIKYLDQIQDKSRFMLLQLGDKGPEVWDLQKALLDRGYELPLDGTFGIETQRQLMVFQESIKSYPSGVLDSDTFDMLFSDSN